VPVPCTPNRDASTRPSRKAVRASRFGEPAVRQPEGLRVSIRAAGGFNRSTGSTATIGLPSGSSAQYVQLSCTANTGWDAAQLSELQVLGR
jgi:hypothetical protein